MKDDLDNHWSGYYDQYKDFMLVNSKVLSRVLSYENKTAEKTFLDIGCGTGQLTRELYHRGYTGVGVDVSESAVRLARNYTTVPASSLQYVHLDIEQGSIDLLPSAPYELIICKLVYAFIKNKATFLGNVSHVLADGGVFVIVTPLREKVRDHKAGIAVDKAETEQELRTIFNFVEHFTDGELDYFLARKSA